MTKSRQEWKEETMVWPTQAGVDLVNGTCPRGLPEIPGIILTGEPAERLAALEELIEERRLQDERCRDGHDDNVLKRCLLAERCVSMAIDANLEGWGDGACRRRLVQAGAVILAALEALGRAGTRTTGDTGTRISDGENEKARGQEGAQVSDEVIGGER